jgi:pyruvate kinase
MGDGMPDKRMHEIIATLGPASWHLAGALRDAGATAFRLNTSHMTAPELAHRVAALRKELPGCPLIIDLQGAKMRLGSFAERPVLAGETVRFALDPGEDEVPIPHKELFASVTAGETLSCDDDRLQFRIISTDAASIETAALAGGILRPRKGANVVEHPVTLSEVSEFDLGCIHATARLDRVAFAFSFMKDGSEATWIRRRAPRCPVLGKIERREAVENAASIARAVDAVWICRGDLGAQLGPAAMARWISGFDPKTLPCPVLMAGQVMEHLTAHGEPTRSEVCHVYDLASRGYAGFVLSDETAVGADPVRAVSILHSLLAAFS